jgi:hypothetical protein
VTACCRDYRRQQRGYLFYHSEGQIIMTVMVMMILMMKIADSILSESVRIFIDDLLGINVETFRPKEDLINEECESV